MGGVAFQQSLAIAIGINQYGNGIPALSTPVSDASAIAHLLKTEHRYNTLLLTDHKATLGNLQHLLHNTLPQQVKSSDRLIFYFAGHGIALNGEDGPEGFLIPQDARLGDTQTYLSMTALQTALSALPCRHFLAIFDCCFAGAFRWSSTRDINIVPEVIHQERYERFLLDPAWQVITSTAYDQTALDSFTFQDTRGTVGSGKSPAAKTHSPFALALLEALAGQADAFPPATERTLSGDGVITATELYLYVRDRVEAPTHQRGQRQTPSLFPLAKHDKGEYIFLTPNHPLNLPPAPPLDPSQNPYRGLEAFEEEHTALFFGRGDRITDLQSLVTEQSLTIVIGPSGSGKSSLVKAGLLPRLRPLSHWHILDPVRPGASPLKVLARVINELGGRSATTDVVPGAPTDSASQHTAGWMLESLAEAVKLWCVAHPGESVVWVIDQFEELITLGSDDTERALFVSNLNKALQSSGGDTQFHVVLTLRADFEPQFREGALRDRWEAARFVLPSMSRADLREAIEQPASAKVMYFQSDDPRQPLVEQIINEVADMPGALPLLSFTLSELYLKFLERQQTAQRQGTALDRAIVEADYKALGGVVRSLTQRADQEYAQLVSQDSAYAETVQHVMLRLLAIGGGDVTRRRVPLAELTYPGDENARAQKVIQQFSAVRLLVKGQDLSGQPYVEPAHDALVRGWQRLLAWQQKEENLGLQRRLTPAALDWQRAQKPRFLWHADPRLEILSQVLKSPRSWLNQLETEFVQHSLARKKRNGRLWISGTLGIVLLLSAGLVAALLGQRQSKVAQIDTYRQSARLSLSQNHSLDGLLPSLAAGELFQHPLLRWFPPDPALRDRVQGTLQWATYNVKEQNRLQGHTGPVRSQWSPQGDRIVSAGEDGDIRVWAADGKELAQWTADELRVWHASFSPDGQRIASASSGGRVRLWSLDGELLAVFEGHQGDVRYVSFSPNGEWLASAGGDDGKVFLWKVPQGGNAYENQPATTNQQAEQQNKRQNKQQTKQQTLRGEKLASWQVDPKIVKSISFHPQQPFLVTTDPNNISIWDFQGKLVTQFQQHAWAAVFTPDGQRVVAAGDDGQVGIWEVATGKRLQLWRADDQRLWNLTLSPDGQQVITAGEDGIIRIWTQAGKLLSDFRNHIGPGRSVSMAPDASRLISAGDDGNTRMWLANTQEQEQFAISGNGGARLQLSAGGDQLLRAQGRQLRLQNLASQSVYQLTINGLQAAEHFAISGFERSPVDRGALEGGSNLNNSAIALANSEGTIALLNPQQNQVKRLKGEIASIQRLRFSADGQRLASSGDSGLIEVWDVATGQQVQQLQEHIGLVHSVDFSPVDAGRLASAGADGTVRLWDIEAGKSVGSPFQVYNRAVLAVAFSPDGTKLVSGDRTGSLQLWDVRQGEQQATWQAHTDALNDVQFSADGQQLTTLGNEGSVKTWPLASFDPLMVQGCDHARNFLAHRAPVSTAAGSTETNLCQ